MNEESELLTVPEAAERLGISIRSLRRVLNRPEYEGKQRQVQRQTKTGTRASLCIPLSLLPLLSEHFEKTENGGNAGKETGADTEANRGNGGIPKFLPPFSPSVDAERVIADKDAEIAFLRSELTANRETHEQEIQRRDTAESELRRLMLIDKNKITELEQKVALLLPSAPNADSDAQVTQRDAEGDNTVKDSLSPKRGFWQRLWGSRKE